jgi:hypothetical protein
METLWTSRLGKSRCTSTLDLAVHVVHGAPFVATILCCSLEGFDALKTGLLKPEIKPSFVSRHDAHAVRVILALLKENRPIVTRTKGTARTTRDEAHAAHPAQRRDPERANDGRDALGPIRAAARAYCT